MWTRGAAQRRPATRMPSQHHFELPVLGYAFDALEPAYSSELLELHYAGHHRAYVDGLNRTLEDLAAMRAEGDFTFINQLERNLAFHLSGHVLHSLFWRNIEPNNAAPPTGQLEASIRAAFGSVDSLRRQFSAAGVALQGSGWVALAWEATQGTLLVEQIHDHQGNCGIATLPVLVMDMWEHAYYLQYKSAKADWVQAFWRLVNWPDVAERFDRVRRLRLL